MTDNAPERISIELLRKLLRYEPETGKLFWRERTTETWTTAEDWRIRNWNKCFAGKLALNYSAPNRKLFYKVGKIFDRNALAHRVAWALHYGEWPCSALDHINRNGLDNRISNLRLVSHVENQRNARSQKRGRCFVPGVTWHKERSKWQVRVGGNKGRYLGLYKCLGQAIKIRLDAQKANGYHVNHGRMN